MRRRNVGLIVLLVGSLVLGFLMGLLNYRIFRANMPQAALSDFARATAPGQFVGLGLLLGVLIFGWSLLAVALARLFRDRPGAAGGGVPSRGAGAGPGA